jgi:hypothetical protein
MELLIIGCLTTLILIAIINKRQKVKLMHKIPFRQSMLHEILKFSMPTNAELKKKVDTQSRIRSREGVIKVIQAPDKKAYWVEDNIFYYAEVVDGQFDPTNKQPVDTNGLSNKEVNKLLFILDNLNKNG